MKPTVTVTHNFPEVALEKLRSRAEVLYNDSGNSLSADQLREHTGKSQALISYLRASTFYSADHDELVARDIDRHFATEDTFIVEKHVMAAIGRRRPA